MDFIKRDTEKAHKLYIMINDHVITLNLFRGYLTYSVSISSDEDIENANKTFLYAEPDNTLFYQRNSEGGIDLIDHGTSRRVYNTDKPWLRKANVHDSYPIELCRFANPSKAGNAVQKEFGLSDLEKEQFIVAYKLVSDPHWD